MIILRLGRDQEKIEDEENFREKFSKGQKCRQLNIKGSDIGSRCQWIKERISVEK